MAGVAAHVGKDGGGHAHAGHHVGVGAVGGENVALVDLVQFQRRAQKLHPALPGPARCAVAFQQHLGLAGRLRVHLAAAHEDGVRVLFQLFVPAGFGAGLHEPQPVGRVDAEFGVHDHVAIGAADGAHALGHLFGLGQRKRPAVRLDLGHGNLLGAALLVVDDLLVLAAHLADDHLGPVVTLEDVELVGGDHAAHHGLAQAVAGVHAHQVLADGAPAAGGGVRAEGGARNDRVDHAHDAHRERGVLDGPFLLGLDGDGFVAGGFGAGLRVQDRLAAVGHGTQVVGRCAVPVIGGGHAAVAHDVQVGVLQAGKGLLARVFAGGGGTHGHGHVFGARFLADGAVGLAHAFVHGLGQLHAQDACLYQHRAFAQLVDAFRRGRKAFHHVVDEGAQLDLGFTGLGRSLGADFLGQVANELLQELRVLVDLGIVPVDAVVFPVHGGADERCVDPGFVEQHVECLRRDGAELGCADSFHLADDGGVVVLAADQQFGIVADAHDVCAGQHQLLGEFGNLGASLGGLGRGLFNRSFAHS